MAIATTPASASRGSPGSTIRPDAASSPTALVPHSQRDQADGVPVDRHRLVPRVGARPGVEFNNRRRASGQGVRQQP